MAKLLMLLLVCLVAVVGGEPTAYSWATMTWQKAPYLLPVGGYKGDPTTNPWQEKNVIGYQPVGVATGDSAFYVWESNTNGLTSIYGELHKISTFMVTKPSIQVAFDAQDPDLIHPPGTMHAVSCYVQLAGGPTSTIQFSVHDMLTGDEIQKELLYKDKVMFATTNKLPKCQPYLSGKGFVISWVREHSGSIPKVVAGSYIWNENDQKYVIQGGLFNVSDDSLDFRPAGAFTRVLRAASEVSIATLRDDSFVVGWSELADTVVTSYDIYISLINPRLTNSTLNSIKSSPDGGTPGDPAIVSYTVGESVRVSWTGCDKVYLYSIKHKEIIPIYPNMFSQTKQAGDRQWVHDPVFSTNYPYVEATQTGTAVFSLGPFTSYSQARLNTPYPDRPRMCRLNETMFIGVWTAVSGLSYFFAAQYFIATAEHTQPTIRVSDTGGGTNSEPTVSASRSITVIAWIGGEGKQLLAQAHDTNTQTAMGSPKVLLESADASLRNPVLAQRNPTLFGEYSFVLAYEQKANDTYHHSYIATLQYSEVDKTFQMITGTIIDSSIGEHRNTKLAEIDQLGTTKRSHIVVWEFQPDPSTSNLKYCLLVDGSQIVSTLDVAKNPAYKCQSMPDISVIPSGFVMVWEERDCDTGEGQSVMQTLYFNGTVTDVIVLDAEGGVASVSTPTNYKNTAPIWATTTTAVNEFTDGLPVVNNKLRTTGASRSFTTNSWLSVEYMFGNSTMTLTELHFPQLAYDLISIPNAKDYSDCIVRDEFVIGVWVDEISGEVYLRNNLVEETSVPTAIPTAEPTLVPETLVPTQAPKTAVPTQVPPSTPEPNQTQAPTQEPTQVPTEVPTPAPNQTEVPTPASNHTQAPTPLPTTAVPPPTTATPTQAPGTGVPTDIPLPTPSGGGTEVSLVLIILLVSSALLCLCLCCILFLLWWRRRTSGSMKGVLVEVEDSRVTGLLNEEEMWTKRTEKISGSTEESHRTNNTHSTDNSSVSPQWKWVPVKPLGMGTFGSVVLGMIESTGSLVAVKTVTAAKPETLTSLKREIKRMSRLSHPNVIKYLGESHEPSTAKVSIFMEYIEGGTLHELALMQFLPERTTARFARQVLQGLVYIHENGIVHRDVKGANILLSKTGRVVLADFGCSRDDISESIATATFAGTPAFLPPEIILASDTPRYTQGADVWAFGCTMVEILDMGRPPWPPSETPWAGIFYMQSVFRDGGMPTNIPEMLTPECREFIVSTFALDPAVRPSAATLLNHPFLEQEEEEDDTPNNGLNNAKGESPDDGFVLA
eukprot:TRINITY_DN514_c8_g1_i1.p1 TRINITY_DN514_c8_g1~~TRINITY_DN514_c8_g1_i1.p1  ORF type:complete len:1280 (+),score=203.93 TRINITY_DN514_c8_g1_i1:91-3930(+)